MHRFILSIIFVCGLLGTSQAQVVIYRGNLIAKGVTGFSPIKEKRTVYLVREVLGFDSEFVLGVVVNKQTKTYRWDLEGETFRMSDELEGLEVEIPIYRLTNESLASGGGFGAGPGKTKVVKTTIPEGAEPSISELEVEVGKSFKVTMYADFSEAELAVPEPAVEGTTGGGAMTMKVRVHNKLTKELSNLDSLAATAAIMNMLEAQGYEELELP